MSDPTCFLLRAGSFGFNVRQPGHVPVQHVWKPLGFVGQLIEMLIGEATTLVWLIYFQPSRIYFQTLPALCLPQCS